MSQLPVELIKEATNCLQLADIRLYSSQFERGDFDQQAGDAMQQHMLQINHGYGSEGNADGGVLQVMVTLGIQLVPETQSGSKASHYLFRIEASFIADYSISGCASDAALDAFAKHNAVHNVWPFWRQHVFDIVQRGKLPSLEVPLMTGVKP